MSLKLKTDYFGLSGNGWSIASTTDNRSVTTAEANGEDGFLVAVESFGERISPSCEYIAKDTATVSGIQLGKVMAVLGKSIALGSVTITTKAGEVPTMTAQGQQIEDNGTAYCTCTLSGITVSGLYHAQDFGLFTITDGQLTDSTLTIEGNIATAEVDGTIKSSDLTGGRVTVSGTVVGVTDAGAISTPSLSVGTPSGNILPGVVTQPLSETNPNGDFPTYSFTITWGLKADTE